MGAQFTHPWATSTDPIAVRIATMSMRCDGMDRKLQGSTIARFKSHIMGKNPIVVCPSLRIFSNRRSKLINKRSTLDFLNLHISQLQLGILCTRLKPSNHYINRTAIITLSIDAQLSSCRQPVEIQFTRCLSRWRNSSFKTWPKRQRSSLLNQ